MQKIFLLGILIVIGLVMISTTFSITSIVAQSAPDNINMTSTDNINMSETGQISKRH
ncbi:MAG TPA: hypothetical protein VIQ04_07135 [Nitrososphaeraceae archaeon]|jgi:hypothetical protein